jgi:Tol biopolymer transport system component
LSIEPGQTLLHYRLIEKIGEGGMGVVWKATDTTLDRAVAIKILPDAFAEDKDRLARFQREAKLLASLNHASIATIHSVHESAEVRFLAMEFVDGEDLAQRLTRGAIPLEEALDIGVQTAQALEAAHEAGVIHRDLKPANIKLTPDGKIKVLDFGLAKATVSDTSARAVDASPSMSPTLTSAGTVAGMILGTASYMSPEQARGKPVDKRADIWAFGCVLYEMLTGRRAFAGSDVPDTLASVLRSEPDWQALPQETPYPLRVLLHRCLAKSPDRRLRDIADARLEVEDAIAGHSGVLEPDGEGAEVEAVAGSRRPTSGAILGAAALALLLGLLAGFLLGRGDGTAARVESTGAGARPPTHTAVNLPDEAPLALGTQYPLLGFESSVLTISPDGRHLVYVGQSEDGTRLFHQDLTGFDNARPIPGTEGAHYAFFSQDSSELGFLTQDRVKKVALAGGNATTLCRAWAPVMAKWIDDTIYFSDQMGFALASVPAVGGECSEIFHSYQRLGSLGWISDVLPEGAGALVSLMSKESSSADYAEIWVVSLEGGDDRALPVTGFGARYLPSGHLVFAGGGKMQAAPFDLEDLDLGGEAVPVLDAVAHESIFGVVQMSVSDSGAIVFVPGGDLARGRLAWVDRQGGEGLLDVPEKVYGVFDVAPDDRRFALQVADVRDYIWLWDAEGGGKTLASAASTWCPLWSPDGEQLAYWAEPHGGAAGGVMVHDLRSGATRVLLQTETEGQLQPNSWARADLLGISSYLPAKVGVVSASSPAEPVWVEQGDAGALSVWPAALAPDASWMAYGSGNVWLEEIDGDVRRQISTDGGVEPIWCRDCDELFYRQGNRIFASRITLEPKLEIGPPRVLFRAVDFVDTKGMSYGISPDGQRAYFVRRTAPPARDRVHIILNWFDELERLVPRGG